MRLFSLFVVFTAFLLPAHAAPKKFGKVNVAGVSIQNLDATAAKRRLTRVLKPKLQTVVTLTDGAKFVKRRRGDLGIEPNIGAMLGRAQKGAKFVPLQFRVNRARLNAVLRRLEPNFRRESQNARPIAFRGRVQIRREQNASQLNLGAASFRFEQQLRNPATKVFRLPTRQKAPLLTAAKLKGINSVIGSFSTSFNPGKVKRTQNMRIAIRAIEGTLLPPGETFSLNQIVGERTQARGYRTTTIFKNGYKVAGLGGGVSQVTGTIFNAALVAGLSIVFYRTHSRPVAYLPLGRDATVSWGGFDMKFKNNRPSPLFVSYKIAGNRATATIFGPKSSQKVSLRVVAKNIGPREKKAQLYRTIRQNGKVVRKEKVGESHYKWNQAEWED